MLSAHPVMELSPVSWWNCRGSIVLAEALKGRRHHAELSTLVSLSVYLPLLRILRQLFGLQRTPLSFLQQTMTSNTVSSGIFESKKKKHNNLLDFRQLSTNRGSPGSKFKTQRAKKFIAVPVLPNLLSAY